MEKRQVKSNMTFLDVRKARQIDPDPGPRVLDLTDSS
jgi:hypothetical protein